jgi:hypothetical protein
MQPPAPVNQYMLTSWGCRWRLHAPTWCTPLDGLEHAPAGSCSLLFHCNSQCAGLNEPCPTQMFAMHVLTVRPVGSKPAAGVPAIGPFCASACCRLAFVLNSWMSGITTSWCFFKSTWLHTCCRPSMPCGARGAAVCHNTCCCLSHHALSTVIAHTGLFVPCASAALVELGLFCGP